MDGDDDIDVDSLLNSPINKDNDSIGGDSSGRGSFRKDPMFRTIKDKITNFMSNDAKLQMSQ